MRPSTPPNLHDREQDGPAFSAEIPPRDQIKDYQRLLLNPVPSLVLIALTLQNLSVHDGIRGGGSTPGVAQVACNLWGEAQEAKAQMSNTLEASPCVNHLLLPLRGPEVASKLGYPFVVISLVVVLIVVMEVHLFSAL